MGYESYYMFSGRVFYPLGGWADYQGECNSIEEGIQFIQSNSDTHDWAQIVNPLNKHVVKFGWKNTVMEESGDEVLMLHNWEWTDE